MGGKRGRPRIFEKKLEFRTTVRFTHDEVERLEMLAQREEMSMNSYLRRLLNSAYDKYAEEKMSKAVEDYYIL